MVRGRQALLTISLHTVFFDIHSIFVHVEYRACHAEVEFASPRGISQLKMTP